MSTTILQSEIDAPWYAGLTPRHWRILWGSYLGWIFDGYEAVALVYALPLALNSILTPQQAQTKPFYVGAAIGITLLGWGIGGLLGGIAADYIGRKRMMMLSILGYALLTGITAFAMTFWQLALLRFVTGIAIGSEWSTGIALVAETWPNKARPKGCGFLQSGFGGGAVLAAIVWFILAQRTRGNGKLAHHVRTWCLAGFRVPLSAARVGRIRALDDCHPGATLGGDGRRCRAAKAHRGQRPFTLAEIFREPESRRRVLLATAMSFATTVGWWAVRLASCLYGGIGESCQRAGRRLGPAHGHHLQCRRDLCLYLFGFHCRRHGTPAILVRDVSRIARHFDLGLHIYWSLTFFMVIAFLNGAFTLGFCFSWMAIYLVELLHLAVRATAASFVFNGARLIAWIFPIIAGQIVVSLGGVAHAALIMSSVYVIGLIVPWFVPETVGRPLPE